MSDFVFLSPTRFAGAPSSEGAEMLIQILS